MDDDLVFRRLVLHVAAHDRDEVRQLGAVGLIKRAFTRARLRLSGEVPLFGSLLTQESVGGFDARGLYGVWFFLPRDATPADREYASP